MSLLKLNKNISGISSDNFAKEFCKHPLVQDFAKEFEQNHKEMIRFLPFDNKRDFKNMHLLYPAWSSRELAINKNINSQLSKLWVYGKYPENFVSCLIDGEVCFILGFVPIEGRQALELSLLSGRSLKKFWSHKFADIFSIYLSLLLKTFPYDFFLASCDQEFPVYSRFTQHFNFVFWENYIGYGRNYSLYIFKTVL